MGLDLNLLVSLDALLQERSVTRAAQRLGLSQPTLSTALGRLRRHFGDELLTRVGNTYELTPLAERLSENTAEALSYTDRVFRTRPDFDPAVDEHEFTLVLTDCQLPTFGRALADLVRETAPGVRLRFRHSTEQFVQRAHDNLRTVDAIVLPQGILAQLPSLDLFQDRWVCVASADDEPAVSSAEELAGRPWVLPYYHPSVVFPSLRRLREGRVEPRPAIMTEDYLAVPHLIAGTDRLSLVPERIAWLFAPQGKTTILDLPFELGVLVETLWWHPMHERDPAHIWLRQIAARAGQLVTASAHPNGA
ncbi:LysR family transcriptional regulator [Streptomyces griseorubiginosus]|uniref:LysR family transcriptional regulator n=1 Tax=Streptomyces griseorubiginosus TaxID=67304 RepID=A0A101RPT1_9ACTN|nr:LysR family transcriptional regulator [Streptomyces griseorubiginosus]KUN59577.1 LysR family transcriptional regulator [Streptomyces griseorubiginosus]